MNCTSCNYGVLKENFIEGQFKAHSCSSCGGDWILIEDFTTWKERHPHYEFAENITFQCDSSDTKKALLCPVTGTIMLKFKISAYNEHRLDYSSAVGGIWLDKGEWQLLKSEGLASSLNKVVTQQWQKSLKEQTTKNNFSDIYSDKFGIETYSKIKEFRDWLISHPQKSDLRAYLLSDNPYSADN